MSQTAFRISAIAGFVALIAGVVIMANDFGLAVPPGTALLPTADEMAAAREKLAEHYLGPMLTLGGTIVMAASTRFVQLDDAETKLLRENFDSSIDWTIKLAELIVLLAGFQLAAQKIDAWPLDVMALALFACLTFHIARPINRVALGPMSRAIPGPRWVGNVVKAAAYVALIALALGFMLAVNSGLRGLIHSAAA